MYNCGKWEKIWKSHCDHDLDWTMSNLSELFSYTKICSSFKWIEPLFSELSCTQTHTPRQKHRQTDRHQDTQTDRQPDRHEYSIVEVDKPQL